MPDWRLNRWQRVVVLLASVIFFVGAWEALQDNERAGTPFLIGMILAVIGLSPPHDGEPWLPRPSKPTLTPSWARLLKGMLGIALVGGMALIFNEQETRKREAARWAAFSKAEAARYHAEAASHAKTAADRTVEMERVRCAKPLAEAPESLDPFPYAERLRRRQQQQEQNDPVAQVVKTLRTGQTGAPPAQELANTSNASE